MFFCFAGFPNLVSIFPYLTHTPKGRLLWRRPFGKQDGFTNILFDLSVGTLRFALTAAIIPAIAAAATVIAGRFRALASLARCTLRLFGACAALTSGFLRIAGCLVCFLGRLAGFMRCFSGFLGCLARFFGRLTSFACRRFTTFHRITEVRPAVAAGIPAVGANASTVISAGYLGVGIVAVVFPGAAAVVVTRAENIGCHGSGSTGIPRRGSHAINVHGSAAAVGNGFTGHFPHSGTRIAALTRATVTGRLVHSSHLNHLLTVQAMPIGGIWLLPFL